MALTYTPDDNLGSQCPDFQLPAVDGKSYSLSDFADKKALVVMFICNHCPYVQAIEDRFIQLAQDFKDQSAQIVGICSNDSADYPEDSFDGLKAQWEKKNYDFPYLHDESQEVAKKFGAVCTPDIFVYNSQRNLTYRGRLDDSWKDESKVTKQELKLAIESILETDGFSQAQHPSMGCSIKWL